MVDFPMKKAQTCIKEKHGRIDIEQPQNIFQYNQMMGGVDRSNQHIAIYWIGHRSKKWL